MVFRTVYKSERSFFYFVTNHTFVRQTDRRTDGQNSRR